MKKVFLIFQLLLVVMLAQAQMMNPVKFTSSLKTDGSAVAEIVFSGKIQPGWHVYSTGLGGDGPISASFNVNKLEGAELVGKLQPRGREIAKFDPLFEMKLRYFEGSVTFVQKVKFTQPNYHIDAYLEYGACNDQNCLPPSEAAFKQSGKSPAVDTPAAGAKDALNAKDAKAIDPALAAKMKADSLAKAAALAQTDSATQPVDSAALASAMENLNVKDLWKPVVKELQAFGGANDIANHSLFYIFFIGLWAVCLRSSCLASGLLSR